MNETLIDRMPFFFDIYEAGEGNIRLSCVYVFFMDPTVGQVLL